MSGLPPYWQILEYPVSIGVFALDKSTRMVPFIYLDREWMRWSEESGHLIGISVASNTGQFPGRSTISHVWPISAGNGYFYAEGEHEPLPDGEVGNPILIRYRFVPPQSDED